MNKSLTKRRVRRHLWNVVRLVKSIISGDDDEVELVHQLRTEARRADAIMKLFGDVLPRRRTAWVRRRLAVIRKKAGRVRDLDVFAVVFSDMGNQLSSPLRNLVDERITSDRVDAMCSLRRYHRKLWKVGFDRRIGAVISGIHWRRILSSAKFKGFGIAAIKPLSTEFFHSIDILKRDEDLFHEVRIQGRQLRYTLELMSEVLPTNEVHSICTGLSEIQRKLGGAHDRLSALNFLRSCSPEFAPMRSSLFEFVELWQAETNVLIKCVVQESIDEAEKLRFPIGELTCLNQVKKKK